MKPFTISVKNFLFTSEFFNFVDPEAHQKIVDLDIATEDKEEEDISEEVTQSVSPPTEATKESALDTDVLNILGEDPNAKPDNFLELHAEIKNRWKTWMKEGLSDEVKKNLLKKYPRKGELCTEPPKINLEIMGALAEITKKRDQHFVEIQEYVGTAIIAVGSAMSLLLKASEEEVDELKLLECLSDTGKLLAETFHQHSAARKAYITPVMKKSMKTLVDSIHSEEWLYGDKLAEQIKEAKTIENACQNLKGTEKTPKRQFPRPQTQGNWKGPSAQYRQTGTFNQRRFLRFKPRTQSRTNQTASREKSRAFREPPKK